MPVRLVEVSDVVPRALAHGNSVGRVDRELYLPERSNVILRRCWRKKQKQKTTKQPNKQTKHQPISRNSNQNNRDFSVRQSGKPLQLA